MTDEELKTAFVHMCEVENDGIIYKRIDEIIYSRTEAGKIILSGNMLDRNRHSVTRARAEKINFVGEAPRFSGKAIGRKLSRDESKKSSV